MILNKNEAIWVASLLATNRYKILKKVDLAGMTLPASVGGEKTALFIDVETTGLDREKDKVIEIGMQQFHFDREDKLVGLGDSYQGFQDPLEPLSADVERITGITNDDLKDKQLDEIAMNKIADGSKLILAHNASFDRPFIERLLPQTKDMAWACSMKDVPWDDWGIKSKSLNYILMQYGLYHDAHRALNDVEACIQLLATTLEEDNRTILDHLLKTARKPTFFLLLTQTPISFKDQLKAQGCQWYPEQKTMPKGWGRVFGEYEDMLNFMDQVQTSVGQVDAFYCKETAFQRYKLHREFHQFTKIDARGKQTNDY